MRTKFNLSVCICVHLWFQFVAFAQDPTTRPGFVIGQLDAHVIPESSGVIASRKYPGVFWTHNDSGNPAEIFAITREGKLIAQFPVRAKNVDWEDIATDDDGHIYIGEIGNNNAKKRQLAVYRVDEPDPHSPAKSSDPLKVTAAWQLRFPDAPFDCESLFIYKDHGYVISKLFNGSEAAIYRFDLSITDKPQVLQPVTRLPIRAPCTGADLSADGKRLAVQTVLGPYLFDDLGGDITRAGRVTPRHVFHLDPNMEGVCFADGGLLATSENQNVYFFSEESFGQSKPPPERPATHITIAPATTQPTIDGDLSDWELTKNSTPMKLEAEATADPAKLWLRWSPAGLYVAAIVPHGKPSPLADAWFDSDVMEIFFGPEKSSRGGDYETGDDRCYVGFAKNSDGGCGDVQIHWPRHKEDRPEGSKAVGRINADGTYQFEAFIPIADLSAEKEIRLNVSILARKPRRNWFISESNAMGTWLSPTTWAVAKLSSS